MYEHHFISYSSFDGRETALRLYEALTAGSPPVSVWLDLVELKAGSHRWDAQLDEALRTCESLIFLMTLDSVESQSECSNEWSRALRYKKPITLLLCDRSVVPPLAFERRQYFDISSGFDAGVQTLRQHLQWLKSPAGLLQELRYRREGAERDLRRAVMVQPPNPVHAARIQDELTELEKLIAAQSEIVANPVAAASRVNASIARGLERERQAAATPTSTVTKFINRAPGVAPEYFQDRHVETQLIVRFLQNDAQRLLTIVGRGGVGKTAMICRLLKALEAGHLPDDLGPMQVDGIVYLSGVGSHKIQIANLFSDLTRLLPDEHAAKLKGIYQAAHLGVKDKISALLEALPPGRIVVLLDNFEDVVDPVSRRITNCELMEALEGFLQLPHHPVKLVITTRVAPLDLAKVQPGRQSRIELDAGLLSPFAENILRAMDIDGKVGLRDAPDDLLSEAQLRTRGYPRALEALFAILSGDRNTSLGEILAQTEALPEGVVEALVGDAFCRLDAMSQQVMQALAVYGRPVTANAIDYMLQPINPSIDSAPVLGRLVNMLMVRKDSGRYHLHPVDAAYALSQILEGEPGDYLVSPLPFSRFALLHRGADYFEQARKPAELWESLDDVASQLAEFDLRCASHDFETAARVLISIDFNYLRVWGHYPLIVQLYERLRDQIVDPQLESSCLGNLGIAYRNVGEAAPALVCFERALQIARSRQSLSDQAVWLSNIGATCDALGQTERSIQCHRDAMAIDQKLGDAHGVGIDLHNLSGRLRELGDLPQAFDCCLKAIEIARHFQQLAGARKLPTIVASHTFTVGLRLGTLASLWIDAEEFEQALAAAREGLELTRGLTAPEISIRCHYYTALAEALRGNFSEAHIVLATAAEFDFPRYNHRVMLLSGIVRWRMDDASGANEVFDETASLARKMVDHCPEYYEALETFAIATCGRSVCGAGQHWTEASRAFQHLRAINALPGMVGKSLRLFDLMATPKAPLKLHKLRPLVAGSTITM